MAILFNLDYLSVYELKLEDIFENFKISLNIFF